MPKDHRIRVRVDRECRFDIKDQNNNNSEDKYVDQGSGDYFRWRTEDGELTVHFPGGSPFVSGKDTVTAQVHQWTKTEQVDDSLPPAEFKYDVTVVKPTGQRCKKDPRIIIQDNIMDEPIRAILMIVGGISVAVVGAVRLKRYLHRKRVRRDALAQGGSEPPMLG